MKHNKIITNNPNKTKKLGENLAKKILSAQGGSASGGKNNSVRKAAVLGLFGNLGSGKTTFLQGFGKGLGIKEKILSPTFIIFRKIKIPDQKNFSYLYHFDCCRIKKQKEILELDFKKIISDPKNIVAVEWPEKISGILPESLIRLKFRFIDKNSREVIIE